MFRVKSNLKNQWAKIKQWDVLIQKKLTIL